MRFLLIAVAMLTLVVLSSQFAFADTVCQPIYGGGQTCQSGNLEVTKNVVNPQTGTDVHDLGETDPTFHAGDIITFHVTVTNTGSANIGSVSLEDDFPDFITFVDGPGNMSGNALSFNSSTLTPNQSQTFTIHAKVVSNDHLPGNANDISCVINDVTATSDSQTAQDSSQFCIQKLAAGAPTPTPAAPIVTTPATGPAELSWIILMGSGVGGYMVNKLQRTRYKKQNKATSHI